MYIVHNYTIKQSTPTSRHCGLSCKFNPMANFPQIRPFLKPFLFLQIVPRGRKNVDNLPLFVWCTPFASATHPVQDVWTLKLQLWVRNATNMSSLRLQSSCKDWAWHAVQSRIKNVIDLFEFKQKALALLCNSSHFFNKRCRSFSDSPWAFWRASANDCKGDFFWTLLILQSKRQRQVTEP